MTSATSSFLDSKQHLTINWKRHNIRWLIIFTFSMLTFAYKYTLNCPIPTQDQLIKEYDINQLQYNLLFSVVAWPNVLACLVVGIITDKIGARFMFIFTFICSIVGHTIFTIGCVPSLHTMTADMNMNMNTDYILMIIGRTIFGLFGRTWTVVLKVFICDFFYNNEISFVLSLNLAMGNISNFVLFLISYEIYLVTSIVFTFVIAGVLQITAIFACSLVLIYIEYRKRAYHKIMKKSEWNIIAGEENMKIPMMAKEQPLTIISNGNSLSVKNETKTTFLNSSKSTVDTNYDLTAGDSNMILMKNENISNYKTANKSFSLETESGMEVLSDLRASKTKIKCFSAIKQLFKNIWSDIQQFDIRYWMIGSILALFTGNVLSWMNIASSFMHHTLDFSYELGNMLVSILFVVIGIETPIFGIIVDKYGHRCQLLFIGCLLLLISHSILAFLSSMTTVMTNDESFHSREIVCVLIALFAMGSGYSIMWVVTWPTIVFIINRETFGTAFGLLTSFANFAMGIFPIIIGIFTRNESTGNQMYLYVEYWMISFSLCVLTLAICS